MCPTNSRQYIKELRGIENKIRREITDGVKDVVNAIFDSLLRPKNQGGTPKKTGWLRSNYIISFNSPTGSPVGSKTSVSTGARDNSYSTFNASSSRALMKINNIIINNQVPYAKAVNDGTINQYGQFFVERAIQDGLKYVTKLSRG